jgi:RNA polymerase sigma-70 factor (ECF subfamily)
MRSDSVLVQLCQDGDIRAFEELVKRYEERVYTVACSILNDADAAQDAAQEAFVRAYQSLGAFRTDSSFYTWLYRIVVNTCLNEARRNKRRGSRVSLEDLNASGSRLPEALFTTETPHDAVDNLELQETIQTMLDGLSEEHRMVVVLKDIEGRSQEEIAELMQCSLGTVKSRLSRARALLQERLRPVYDEWTGRDSV